jgi:hypothetical protein
VPKCFKFCLNLVFEYLAKGKISNKRVFHGLLTIAELSYFVAAKRKIKVQKKKMAKGMQPATQMPKNYATFGCTRTPPLNPAFEYFESGHPTSG